MLQFGNSKTLYIQIAYQFIASQTKPVLVELQNNKEQRWCQNLFFSFSGIKQVLMSCEKIILKIQYASYKTVKAIRSIFRPIVTLGFVINRS